MEYLFYYIPPTPNKVFFKKKFNFNIFSDSTGTVNLNYLNY